MTNWLELVGALIAPFVALLASAGNPVGRTAIQNWAEKHNWPEPSFGASFSKEKADHYRRALIESISNFTESIMVCSSIAPSILSVIVSGYLVFVNTSGDPILIGVLLVFPTISVFRIFHIITSYGITNLAHTRTRKLKFRNSETPYAGATYRMLIDRWLILSNIWLMGFVSVSYLRVDEFLLKNYANFFRFLD